MRNIFFGLTMLASIQCTAQKDSCDCSKLIDTTYDKIDNTMSVCSKSESIIGGLKEGALVMMCWDGNKRMKLKIAFVFQRDLVCIAPGNKMTVLFRDGIQGELINDVKYNCKGIFFAYFGGLHGKKDMLKKMKTTPIEMVRLYTSTDITDVKFSPEEGEELRKRIKCTSELF